MKFILCLIVPAILSGQAVRFIRATSTRAVVEIDKSVTGTCTGTLTHLDRGAGHERINGIDLSTLADYYVKSDGTRVVTLGSNTANWSLEMESNYRLQLGGCSTAAVQFTTPSPHPGPQLGMPVPFDSSRWGNRSWPEQGLDLSNKNRIMVDPLTGVPMVSLIGTGEFGSKSNAGGFGFLTWYGGSAWSNRNNILSGSLTSTASVSGSTDTIELFVDPTHIPWARAALDFFGSGSPPGGAVDNLGLILWGSGSSATAQERRVRFCIKTTTCIASFTVDLPQGSVAKVNSTIASGVDADRPFPNEWLDGTFTGWTGGGRITRNMFPQDGTLTVSGGSTLQIGSPNLASHFPLTLQPGNRIRLVGSGLTNDLATIATVVDHDTATIVETVTNGSYPYVAYPFSITVEKVVADGTVNVGLKWKTQGTASFTPSTTEMKCNPFEVTDDGTAGGKPGQLCAVTNKLSFISNDLSVRRLVSIFYLHANQFSSMPAADRMVTGSTFLGTPIPDPTNSKAFYLSTTTTTGVRSIWRAVCSGNFTSDYVPGLIIRSNESISGSEPAPTQDCFTYTNLMPPSQGKDLATQVAALSLSGIEYTNSTGGNVNWNAAAFSGVSGTKAFFYTIGGAAGPGSQDQGPCLIAVVELTTGTLEKVVDTYSGLDSSEPPQFPANGRWGACHSVQAMPELPDGTVFVSQNRLGGKATGGYLGGPYDVTPNAILMPNGSWSSNTAMAWPTGDAANTFDKACPSDIPQWTKDLGATGDTCVTLRLPHHPCFTLPSAQALADQPECPSNASRTMPLQLRVGDRMFDQTTFGGVGGVGVDNVATEQFRLVKISDDDGQLRTTWARNAVWEYCCRNDDPATPRTAACQGSAAQMTHDNGFTLRVTSGSTNSCTNTPQYLRFGSGGTILNSIEGAPYQNGHSRSGGYKDSQIMFTGFTSSVIGPLSIMDTPYVPPGMPAHVFPRFNGYTSNVGDGQTQAYFRRDQKYAAEKELEWSLDGNSLNSGSPGGALAGSRTLTAVGGMTDVYQIGVKYTLDYKRRTLAGWAGINTLQDVSPANINSAPYYSFCHVYRTGACGTGSVGQTFVKVPRVFSATLCEPAKFWANNPCVFSLDPISGWGRRMVSDKHDMVGMYSQNLTQGLTGIGHQYSFWGPAGSPNGRLFGTYAGAFVDGIRSPFLVGKMPKYNGARDVPTGYVKMPVQVGGYTGMTHARVRFGYNAAFRCMGAAAACVTDDTMDTLTVPFAFDDETLNPHSCSASTGCTLSVPLVPGRLAYYRIERYNGSFWTNGDIQTAIVQ